MIDEAVVSGALVILSNALVVSGRKLFKSVGVNVTESVCSRPTGNIVPMAMRIAL